MKILSAGHVLPITSDPIRDGAIAIDGDRIAAIGTIAELTSEYPHATHDSYGEAVLLPGLVNCHSHLEVTIMRGFLDDLDNDFSSWLIKLTNTRAECLTEEDIFLSAAFGALEGVRAGITSFGDIGRAGMAGLEALKINGLRGVVFQETEFSPDDRTAGEDFEKLIDKFSALRENQNELARAGISPHAPYTVSRRLFEKIGDLAAAEGIRVTIHAAESENEVEFLRTGKGFFAGIYKKFEIPYVAPGMSPVEFLESTGILRASPLLVHCVAVSASDIELIGRSGSKVAHCPKSNAKFGHGVAPFGDFIEQGVCVGFGSDSMASNNSCDLFEEARFAALLARTREAENQTFPDARKMLETATIGGARALGLESEIGSLEAGKQADIIAVSLESPAQIPAHEIHSALIFATNARDVKMTMVAGKELYRDGIIQRLDEGELKDKMKEIAGRMTKESR